MLSGLMMDYPLTIDRVLEHGNRLYPNKQIKTKLPDGSLHVYTYRDLYRRVKRLCNLLEGLGVEPGDRVGTFAWNNYQHVELYFGAPGAGAVLHTLNIRLFPEQLAYIINHAEDKVIFVDTTLLPLIERVAEQIGAVKHFVLFNTPPQDAEANLPGQIYDYEALMATAGEEYSWRVEDENQALGLCYTSGTTGHPKGALYSHRSMYLHTIGSCQAAALGLTENDVIMPVVPQFHAMAWGLPYSAINVGANLVLPGPHMQPSALAALMRGPWVARAYYKLDGGSDSFTADGWFRTGDVVTISEDGFMSVTDRTKDLVKSGGEWISSVELENLLMAHPQVLEAAVIAIPHERWQERPLAVYVPTKDADPPTADQLRRFLEPQIARFWLPDEFVQIDEIPKTGTGKFDKKVLRERFAV